MSPRRGIYFSQSADQLLVMADENMVVNAVDPHDDQNKIENNGIPPEEEENVADEGKLIITIIIKIIFYVVNYITICYDSRQINLQNSRH